MMRMNSLFLVLLAAGCLIESGCGHGPPAVDKNVIVLVIDTLRRDRLHAFGFDGNISPCMDELAVDGFCFRKAFAPSSWTKPSVASLLTGLYPGRHGAVGCPTFLTGLGDLKESHRTLAEYLKEAGYFTAAMVTNPHIVPKNHFDQGFDEFVEPAGNAEVLLDKALEWIRGRAGAQRYFLYLHIFDPHMPYAPPAPYQKIREDRPGGRIPVRTAGEPPGYSILGGAV
jgi:arylsulfatase A-like enzyme